ncbi:hypothetical protein [Methylobacterium sp. V23]|uniref:hypothetical protein n=1 Tax=Methylobacterium sp. V23 TaxID=2044878 RepID=UPI000CDA434C|nr:hypothetical protein [Methylobacterium sp. V23]POR41298.1 hypothetical protein CRT23_19260 [Methylobacterium sp. V23]
MNDFTRLREILPFAAALYLATSIAQLQATQAGDLHRTGQSIGSVVSSLKWHMLQVAGNERSEGLTLFPGN